MKFTTEAMVTFAKDYINKNLELLKALGDIGGDE